MYGTVAKLTLKPGAEAGLTEEMKVYESLNIDGYVGTVVYKLDAAPNQYMMAVLFKDQASYTKNADDPAQDKRFQAFRALLTADPEWNDGEVVYSKM